MVNDLVEDLQKAGFMVNGCADDIAIIVDGNLHNSLKDLMINTLKLIQGWCENVCLTRNPLKTKSMDFTWKHKPEPIELLSLGGREVAVTNSVKYLGVFLDPKIIWKQHITERKDKFFSSVWACRRAMGIS